MVEPIAKTDAEFIGVNQSIARQTPKPSGVNFSDVVKKGSAILLDAVGSASTLLPGGGLLAAAVRGGQSAQAAGSMASAAGALSSGEDPRTPGTGSASVAASTGQDEFSDFWRLQKEGQLMNLEFLKIQESLSRENRIFSTVSNVLKARHETTRNAINNIR